MYQFFTNWSDWLKNTLLLDVNCLAAQTRFAGTGCTKHENVSFMDISLFLSWFYWLGEESRKSEFAENCHVIAGTANFKREAQCNPPGQAWHLCTSPVRADQNWVLVCLFVFPSHSSLFLPRAKPAVWGPAHSQWGSPPSSGFLREMCWMKAADGARTWRCLVQPSCVLCVCPCSVQRCWVMGGPGGKDTGMLPHFSHFSLQITCVGSNFCKRGLCKWTVVNLTGFILLGWFFALMVVKVQL